MDTTESTQDTQDAPQDDEHGECWDCGFYRWLTPRGQCSRCYGIDNY